MKKPCQICHKEIEIKNCIIGSWRKGSPEKKRRQHLISDYGANFCNRWFCNECLSLIIKKE
jgi:hypothetical protein